MASGWASGWSACKDSRPRLPTLITGCRQGRLNCDPDLAAQFGHQFSRGFLQGLLHFRRVSPSRTSRLLLFVFASCGFCQGTAANVSLDGPATVPSGAIIVSPFPPRFPSHLVQGSVACAALQRRATRHNQLLVARSSPTSNRGGSERRSISCATICSATDAIVVGMVEADFIGCR